MSFWQLFKLAVKLKLGFKFYKFWFRIRHPHQYEKMRALQLLTRGK